MVNSQSETLGHKLDSQTLYMRNESQTHIFEVHMQDLAPLQRPSMFKPVYTV